jgi:hypothetical protein
MAPPHTDTEVVDPQMWGGAMRCKKPFQQFHKSEF